MTVLFKPILALHINFQVVKIIGGGGQNDMFAPPPNILIWGRLPPPPPIRIDASGTKWVGGKSVRVSARLIRVGSSGPPIGPLPGVQGAEPPEALEFSANKGLQNGRERAIINYCEQANFFFVCV